MHQGIHNELNKTLQIDGQTDRQAETIRAPYCNPMTYVHN